jgi:hypothetical protein
MDYVPQCGANPNQATEGTDDWIACPGTKPQPSAILAAKQLFDVMGARNAPLYNRAVRILHPDGTTSVPSDYVDAIYG